MARTQPRLSANHSRSRRALTWGADTVSARMRSPSPANSPRPARRSSMALMAASIGVEVDALGSGFMAVDLRRSSRSRARRAVNNRDFTVWEPPGGAARCRPTKGLRVMEPETRRSPSDRRSKARSRRSVEAVRSSWAGAVARSDPPSSGSLVNEISRIRCRPRWRRDDRAELTTIRPNQAEEVRIARPGRSARPGRRSSGSCRGRRTRCRGSPAPS